MEYNKNGEVDKYYNLDDILRLNLSDEVRKNFEKFFNKRVFWDNDGSCRVGKLIGLERNTQLSEIYYIMDVDGTKNFVSIWKSITKM